MVNHNHDRVKTINGGKVSDKVHKEVLERARPLEGKGVVAGTIGWVSTLYVWQTTHPGTYFWM